MSISTHILDTSLGRPATGVAVSLARRQQEIWHVLCEAKTDTDGRCNHLLPVDSPLESGLYRIRFETAAYCRAQHTASLYPYVEIVFEVRDTTQHYHIPLLLAANGYTTYRGN
jgi:5-hydroxyisourate hydrolase